MKELKLSKTGHMTDIFGRKKTFKIGKHVMLPESGYGTEEYPAKMLVLQEITSDNTTSIRICYYIYSKKASHWMFGQYAPFILKQDLKQLLKLAKAEGII